ncbi:shikimate kinase [Oceanicaulis sp.]|jgi:shikimate kinase|uniref:shikimate kinase n=1 Tax=Oceanicaulis sp. TaxID=1924941 RepID=UPI003F710993
MTNSENPPVLSRHLTLVGLMGVGKTTIGRRLARRFGAEFRDADEEVERAAGRTVSEIFADFGEPAFREGERKVIDRLLAQPDPLIIGLGGGAFIQDETRALVKDKAISVWLKADLDVLIERVGRKPGARPLLSQGDPAEIMARLERERAPLYAEADIVVDTSVGSHEQSADQVIDALRTYQEGMRE